MPLFFGVFVNTNAFREDLAQYWNFQEQRLIKPTSSSITIIETANEVLKKIYRQGYQYKKAGVIVMGVCLINKYFFMSDYNKSGKTMCVAINGQTLLEEEYDASFNLFDYVTPNPFVFDIVLTLLDVTYKLYSSISFRHLFKVYEDRDLDDAYKINRNEFWDILKSNGIDTDDILRKLDGDYIELSDALASDNQAKFFSLIGNYSRVAQVANMYSSLKKATF